jgi:hypothetical protein
VHTQLRLFSNLFFFQKQIVAGMLQIPDEIWRRPHDEPPDVAKKNVSNFVKIWEPFDWTTQLEGGEYQ